MHRDNYTGEKIRQLRIEHGMTQDELAEQMYCARSAISKLETGMRDPTYQEIEALCRIFGCTPNDFFRPEMCEELLQYNNLVRALEKISPKELKQFMRIFMSTDDRDP